MSLKALTNILQRTVIGSGHMPTPEPIRCKLRTVPARFGYQRRWDHVVRVVVVRSLSLVQLFVTSRDRSTPCWWWSWDTVWWGLTTSLNQASNCYLTSQSLEQQPGCGILLQIIPGMKADFIDQKPSSSEHIFISESLKDKEGQTTRKECTENEKDFRIYYHGQLKNYLFLQKNLQKLT